MAPMSAVAKGAGWNRLGLLESHYKITVPLGYVDK
jgi:hypothetical protein